VQFGNVLVGLVDFPLRGSFDRYRQLLEGVRSEWSEEQYLELQDRVERVVDEYFGAPTGADASRSLDSAPVVSPVTAPLDHIG
jgi:hypothetical protein